MLPQTSWKLEAMGRLVLSVLCCVLAGNVVSIVVYVFHQHLAHDWKLTVSSSAALAAFGVALAALRRPWSIDNFLPRAIITLSFLYLGMACEVWAGNLAHRPSGRLSPGQMLVAFLCFQGAALFLVQHFLKEHSTHWTEGFGFSNHWYIAVLWGLIVGLLFFQLGNFLLGLCSEVMQRLPMPIKPEEQPAVQTLRLATRWAERVVLGIGTMLLAPFAEETLFRGILYPTVKRAGFPKAALWGTSLLFALIHTNVVSFLPLFLLALILTFLYEHTGNLLAPITAHAVFNAMNFIALYSQSPR